MFNVIITGLASLFTDISSEMVYPLVPLYLTIRLGATPAIVGLIEGIAESIASLLKVFSGRISDKIGKRKPLMLGGYSASVIGKYLLYLSNSWAMVLGARVMDRFGKGVRTAPRDALIADSTVKKGKKGASFGLHRALDTLGACIGILLGYYFLTHYAGDYQRVFIWAIFPALVGVLILLGAREVKNIKTSFSSENKVSLSFRWAALDKKLKAFLIISFVFTLGNSSNQFLLLRASNLGFSPANVILLYLVYNLSYFLLAYPAGRISDRIGRKKILILGYLFYGLVYLGFALVDRPFYLLPLFLFYGFYYALTEGIEKAFVSDLAPQHLQATLIGLHATIVGIGLLPASLIAGILWNVFGPRAPFYLGGATGLFASFCLWKLI